MQFVKNSPFYKEAIQEINFDFGNYYLFDSFIIGEVHEDVVFTWEDHGKILVKEFSNLYDQNGNDIVYITNRVHEYSVVPSDWINFYKYQYSLKGYAIVSYTPRGILNIILEKIFMRNKIKGFDNLSDAVSWAKSLSKSSENAA